MGEEKKPISIDELFFSSGSEGHFFKDSSQELQKYCYILQYAGSRDADMIYHGLCNLSYIKIGDPEPTRIDILEENRKIPKRLIDRFERRKRFLFINAPKGVDITEILGDVYSLDMGGYKLELSKKRTIFYTRSQRALSRLGSLSQ